MENLDLEQKEDKEYKNTSLKQWPIQIKLAPSKHDNYKDANLVIAADCTAYAYADFHKRFMKDKILLIGCTKLDGENYSNKLTEIFKLNDFKNVIVVRMSLKCCAGIVDAVQVALHRSGKVVSWQIVTISTDGKIVS